MARYVKQRDRFRCGPIAIFNAMRWAGHNVRYEDCIPHLHRMCRCAPGKGTYQADFDSAIRRVGKEAHFSVEFVRGPYLWYVEEHLKGGGAVIFSYKWRLRGEQGKHLVLVNGVSNTGKIFYTVNDYQRGPALQAVTRRIFTRRILQFQRVDDYLAAWFLTLE